MQEFYTSPKNALSCPAYIASYDFLKGGLTTDKAYQRGDMFYADLGQGLGSEQSGYRPVVIVQNDTGNRYSPTVIVAAISSRVDIKAKLPTHYLIGVEDGLARPSIILMEQLRTVDKSRLDKHIGRLSQAHLQGMNNALSVSVGLAKALEEKYVLCLCKACLNNFRAANKYRLIRVWENREKDVCTFCNSRLGYDYELRPIKE